MMLWRRAGDAWDEWRPSWYERRGSWPRPPGRGTRQAAADLRSAIVVWVGDRIGGAVPLAVAGVVVLPVLWVSVDFTRRREALYVPDMFETMLASMAAAHGDQYTGAWSRIGINHLGPAWFYWAAPFVRASGDHPASLVLAAGALAAFSLVVAIVVIGRATGGMGACVAGAVALAGLVHLNLLGVVAPWNPTILILPTVAGLVCAAAAWSRGSLAAAAGATLFGALVAQSHLGAIGLGLAIIVGGVAGACCARRHHGRAAPRSRLLLVVAVAIVPWVPVLVDQAVGVGNAGAVASYAVTGKIRGGDPHYQEGSSQDLTPVEAGRRLTSITFLAEPDVALWAGVDYPAGETHQPSRRSWVAGLFVVTAASVIARPRQRWPDPRHAFGAWLCRAGLVGLACQVLATEQLRHQFRPYLVAGSAGVGLALWIGVAIGGLTWARSRAPGRLDGLMPIACAAALMVTAAIAYPRLDWRIDGGPLPPRSASVFAALIREDGGAPVKLHVDSERLIGTYVTYTWELEQRGVRVAVRGRWSSRFSDRQRRAPFTGREVLLRSPEAAPRPDCTNIGAYRGVVLCLKA